MRIALYSSDGTTRKVCRETLLDCADVTWHLTVSDYEPETQLVEADVYIWDTPTEGRLRAIEAAPRQSEHIFFVENQHISWLGRLKGTQSRVLLKPVNRMLLRLSIEEAASHCATAGSGDKRSAPDGMIQFLLEMNVRLQAHDHARNQLVSQVLNDFCEPLMAMDGYCDLLIDRKLGSLNTDQATAIQRMKQSVKRLSRISASVPQLTGGDQARLVPRFLPGDIEECIAEAVCEVNPIVDSRKLEIFVETIPPEGEFWFDRAQIEQLVVNLLDTACRFSPSGGRIEIQGKPIFWDRRAANLVELTNQADRRRVEGVQEANAFQIEVSSSGPGIPAEELERLSPDFAFAGTPHNGSTLTGLGLAACKQIANRHGGRISTQCSADSNRFSVVLPLTHRAPKGVTRASGVIDQPSARAYAT